MTSGYDLFSSFLLRDDAHILAKVCPILKSGVSNNFENYRPITILSNFGSEDVHLLKTDTSSLTPHSYKKHMSPSKEDQLLLT